jgi:hypothetical protein
MSMGVVAVTVLKAMTAETTTRRHHRRRRLEALRTRTRR